MLHVIFQSKELQVLIVYDRTSIWVLMFGISHEDPVEKFTEEYCRSAMDKAIGEQTDYEIANICAWEAPLRISDFYSFVRFQDEQVAIHYGEPMQANLIGYLGNATIKILEGNR
ncbi:hypothetical protein APSETT445_002575 [Aspergillus pseudonomiae]